MTANELLANLYRWADANAGVILILSVVLPLIGAVAARIGKGGKTDSDGRLIASVVVGSGLTVFVFEVAMLVFARSVLKTDILEANAMLLAAPVIYMGLGLATIRSVFPLSELGSFRQAADIAAFVLVCWGIVWLFGKFQWGVIFFGTVTQLVLILALGAILVHRLYKRAFKSPLS